MDMFKAMNIMDNPQAYMAQRQMQAMIQQHPKEWKAAQEMFAGKDRKQQLKELRKLYANRGMDLDQTAAKYGIAL